MRIFNLNVSIYLGPVLSSRISILFPNIYDYSILNIPRFSLIPGIEKAKAKCLKIPKFITREHSKLIHFISCFWSGERIEIFKKYSPIVDRNLKIVDWRRKEISGVMEMFYILFYVVITGVNKTVKIHQTEHRRSLC